jgi:hypothetical protein
MSTRIRTVKPDFFRHSGLFLLERQTKLPIRLGFEGLWIVADREGRFRWRPEELKLDVLPYDDVDFAVIMGELERHRFVVQYQVEGELYGFIPTWSRHQRPNNKESKSRLPAPPESFSLAAQLQLEIPAVIADPSRDHDAARKASSRVGQDGKSCSSKDRSDSGGSGTGSGTGSGKGSKPPLPPLEVLPAPAAEKSKPGDDQTPPPLTKENGNDSVNVVPLDLTEVEYARKLLDDLGSPSKGNIAIVADSIRALAKSKALPLPAAFEQMHAIAFEARARGEPVDHLWFLNTRYNNPRPRSKSDVASDQFHDRFREEFAILDRQQSRAKSA